MSLANAERDGRILLTAEPLKASALADNGQAKVTTATATMPRPEVSLKYMLLAPSESFREVAEDARSVVLAGGTMSPVSVGLMTRVAFNAQTRQGSFVLINR